MLPVSGTLWASRADRRRLRKARSAVLMIGGYDGSGNFGDVLQLAGAIEIVRGLPGSPLPVAIVERGFQAGHESLLSRFPDQLGAAVYAHYDGPDSEVRDRLVELAPGSGPSQVLTYLYGGGYMNRWWGERKVALTAAAEGLGGDGARPLVASGLQVEDGYLRSSGEASELISRASLVGVRDIESLEVLRAHLEAENDDRVTLIGDDATPFLDHGPASPETVVNLHLNGNDWVSDAPEAMTANLIAILRRLGETAGGGLELQPVIAYEDPRISEASLLAEVLEASREDLARSGLSTIAPLDVLADAVGNRLARFRRARLTISCSYHVALSSLLAGIPTLLLAENGYYDQKAAGLRDLFGLDRSMLGVRAGPEDAAAAVRAFSDGSTRTALVGQLRDRARQLAERQQQGRAAIAAAAAAGLGPPPRGLRRRLLGV